MAGIYIHIPFCKSKCTYCDFASYPSKLGLAEAYMACVYKEMSMRQDELKNKTFDTVYFGGGTPSIIDEKYILGCMNQIKKCFNLTSDAEITIEINPGTITKEKVETYKKGGINRYSIGMQSASNCQLVELNRIHTVEDFIECNKLLGDVNKNADILIGLKNQTIQDVKEAIDLACKVNSSHVSMYALTPEEGTPIFTQYLNGELPDSDETASLYDYGYKYLEEKGFLRYEVSNFAKEGKGSRHNLNYWKRGEYIGFGVASSSFINDVRFTNTLDLDEYIKCILTNHYPVIDSEKITPEDAKFEFVMLGMRTIFGINKDEYKSKFGTDFDEDFKEAIKKNTQYLLMSDSSVRIKDEYLFVQNQVIVDFLNN